MINYYTSIGLETHIELSTSTKIFCGCKSSFGSQPNTNCCPICTGMPGTLPRLNKQVMQYAMRMGLSLGCKISSVSYMDRKNYSYPDLAKAYQISQYYVPMCTDGKFKLSNGNIIRINRIHIEEDAGKIINAEKNVYIDYNRAGVPLIEIVTEPDFHSDAEVIEYLEKIRLIAKYLDISDCKMQEGSMRSDVNISVRNSEKIMGERCEIKNMSSFSNISKAIKYESARQIKLIDSGKKIERETLGFDESACMTYHMRSKEELNDYRYFKDPDIMPIYISEAEKNAIKSSLPELPDAKLVRYINEFKLKETEAKHILKYVNISKYFEELVNLTDNPKMSASIILTHIFRIVNEDSMREEKFAVTPNDTAEVINLIQSGKILPNFTKKIIDKMFSEGKSFYELFDLNDLKPLDNETVLKIIKEVIDNNKKIVDSYKSGKTKALAALMGQVMKKLNGRADAEQIQKIIVENM